MLENIAKALTRRLLKDEPGIGAREVSARVTKFVRAVRSKLGTSWHVPYVIPLENSEHESGDQDAGNHTSTIGDAVQERGVAAPRPGREPTASTSSTPPSISASPTRSVEVSVGASNRVLSLIRYNFNIKYLTSAEGGQGVRLILCVRPRSPRTAALRSQ